MSAVEIKPVTTRREKKQFLELPGQQGGRAGRAQRSFTPGLLHMLR